KPVLRGIRQPVDIYLTRDNFLLGGNWGRSGDGVDSVPTPSPTDQQDAQSSCSRTFESAGDGPHSVPTPSLLRPRQDRIEQQLERPMRLTPMLRSKPEEDHMPAADPRAHHRGAPRDDAFPQQPPAQQQIR